MKKERQLEKGLIYYISSNLLGFILLAGVIIIFTIYVPKEIGNLKYVFLYPLFLLLLLMGVLIYYIYDINIRAAFVIGDKNLWIRILLAEPLMGILFYCLNIRFNNKNNINNIIDTIKTKYISIIHKVVKTLIFILIFLFVCHNGFILMFGKSYMIYGSIISIIFSKIFILFLFFAYTFYVLIIHDRIFRSTDSINELDGSLSDVPHIIMPFIGINQYYKKIR